MPWRARGYRLEPSGWLRCDERGCTAPRARAKGPAAPPPEQGAQQVDGILSRMLLLDDDDELPRSPAVGEATLTAQLGADGLRAIDAALQRYTRGPWLKAARVVSEAVAAGGFSLGDDSHIELHVRRLIVLVDSGVLEGQGNLRKPRRSEVRHVSSRSNE